MLRAIAARRRDRSIAIPGPLSRLGRRVKAFARDESGNVTVEAVLWLPFFFGFLMLVTEVSLAFYGKAQIFRIVQNANRGFSVNTATMGTDAQVEAWIRARIAGFSPNATINTQNRNGVIWTRVNVPARDLTLFGGFGMLEGLSITVQSAIFDETPAT